MPAGSRWGFASGSAIMKIAENMLAARIELAKKNKVEAISLLKKAVLGEDSLAYDEPPDWDLPCREALGAALISAGMYNEAEEVFLAELERHPLDSRALF